MRRSSCSWLLIASFAFVSSACGEKPPAPAPAVPAAPDIQAAPAAPPSKAPEALELLKQPFIPTPTSIETTLALADTLTAEPTPEARRLAARLRLAVVATTFAATTPTTPSLLTPDASERQLRLIRTTDTEDGIQTAARALLALAAGKADELPPATALRALAAAAEPTPERAALRLALLATYEAARASGDPQQFASLIGPTLCDACASPAPDLVARPASDGSGLGCAADTDAPFCASLRRATAIDPLAADPMNALTLAAFAQTSAWAADLAPLAAPATHAQLPDFVLLPSIALLQRDHLAAPSTLRTATPAALAVTFAADGARVGLRPVAGPLSAPEPFATDALPNDAALRKAPAVTAEALAAAPADAPVPELGPRLATLRAEQAAFIAAHGLNGAALTIAVAPDAPPALIAPALDALLADPAPATTALALAGGEEIPTYFRKVPDVVGATLSPRWARPLSVVVRATALEIWAPEGPQDDARPIGPDLQASLPATLEQGWRGETLARLRLPLPTPPDGEVRPDAVDSSALATLVSGLTALATPTASGPLVHVIAAPDARVADVLRVVQHLQGSTVAPLPPAAAPFPANSARCRGAAPAAGLSSCVQALPVAWSALPIPSERGLTAKPTKAQATKAPEPPKGPAPSPEFCNNADIKAQILKKTGAIRFCYERELQLQKDLEGRLVVGFVIGLDGAVKAPSVASSTLQNAKVGPCVVKEIAKMQFKPPQGGECIVRYPFVFSANN